MAAPKIIELKYFEEGGGKLMVAERLQIDNAAFHIKRIFVVEALRGSIRGMHSHIRCSQILVAIHGEISVSCENQNQKFDEFHLNEPSKGLYIPPGIWSTQRYHGNPGSKLLVICDKEYDELDYIRNYQDFLDA